MIAILQFDSVSVPLLNELMIAACLPTLEGLRREGIWLSLGTPAEYFEGSGSYAIYTGTDVGVHGQYYPWLWSPSEQRVRFMDDLPIPETLWDLIVQWNDRAVTATAGVSSAIYGEISSQGWGTGRTGCYNGDAWVLLVPGRSRLKTPQKTPHVVDVASTVCAVIGADTQGMTGQPLLERS